MAEAEAATYKIIDLSKVPSAEAGRAGKYDLIVTYQDAAGRVRIVTKQRTNRQKRSGNTLECRNPSD